MTANYIPLVEAARELKCRSGNRATCVESLFARHRAAHQVALKSQREADERKAAYEAKIARINDVIRKISGA
jgi:hypothetical protein